MDEQNKQFNQETLYFWASKKYEKTLYQNLKDEKISKGN